jgi:hypothetical protein
MVEVLTAMRQGDRLLTALQEKVKGYVPVATKAFFLALHPVHRKRHR